MENRTIWLALGTGTTGLMGVLLALGGNVAGAAAMALLFSSCIVEARRSSR